MNTSLGMPYATRDNRTLSVQEEIPKWNFLGNFNFQADSDLVYIKECINTFLNVLQVHSMSKYFLNL